MNNIYKQIAQLAKNNGAVRVVLFGSRARGDNRSNSDIDIAVYGMPKEKQGAFWSDIDELPTLAEVDIVHITDRTDKKLIENIKKDGVTLMDKFIQKYNSFISAVQRLKEAVSSYDETGSDIVRDGAIQRFEFCTELAWKTTREKLIDGGYTDLNSPKAVMRQAFAGGIIGDEQEWINLLNDRNLTSHIYDEATAEEIFGNIKDRYVRMFTELSEALSK